MSLHPNPPLSRLSSPRIAAPHLVASRSVLEKIKRAIQPHVITKATYFVDRAGAETLFQFDEQDAAVAIMAPYAYGEKSGEVEVRVEDRVATSESCEK